MSTKSNHNNTLAGPDSRGIGSIAAVGAIAGIGIVFLVLFFISTSGGGNKSKGSTKNEQSTEEQEQAAAPDQPEFIRIPENYVAYINKDYKYSFAYPQPWSPLSMTKPANALFYALSPTFTKYALGNSILDGNLSTFVYKKDQLTLVLRPNGASVTAVKLGDTYGWKVVAAGQADPNLKVGDSHSVTATKYQANILTYDFSNKDASSVQGRWVFEAGENFVGVTMPAISNPSGGPINAKDLATYNIISNNIVRTMRPFVAEAQASTGESDSAAN